MGWDIVNNWKETTLGEVAEDIAYGYTESANNENVGPKFLRITDIQDDFINWDAVPYCPISEKDHKKYKLEIGDVVIARTGNSTGATATIKKEVDAVFASYLIRFKIDAQKADYLFIDFLLRSEFWKAFVKSVKGGSAQGGANAKNFAEFPILLPPLPEQKAIAAILSSFDDKIELLRRQNRTLEQIAQTIFKEWFVKFTVNGKKLTLGKKTGLPEGWRMGKYGELADVTTGKGLKNEFIKEKGKYSILGANGELGKTDSYLFDEDLILTGRVGTLGTIYISRGKTWISDNVLISKPLCDENFYFVYFNLKRLNFESLNRGSTQPLITQTDLKNVEVIIPKQEVLGAWDNGVSSLFDKIYNNNSQIQTLSKLRDTLLPKLMKGEIRVKDADNLVKEKIK